MRHPGTLATLALLVVVLGAAGCGGSGNGGFDSALARVPAVHRASRKFGYVVEQTCAAATRGLKRAINDPTASLTAPITAQLRGLKRLHPPPGERAAYDRLVLVVEHFQRILQEPGTDFTSLTSATQAYEGVFRTLVRELAAPTCLAEVGGSRH